MDSLHTSLPVKDVSAASRLLTLVGIMVVIVGPYFGQRVLITLALAVVLAFLLTPIVRILLKGHLGRVTSALTVLVLSFVLLAVRGWSVSNQLMAILERLPDYKANSDNKIVAIWAPVAAGSER